MKQMQKHMVQRTPSAGQIAGCLGCDFGGLGLRHLPSRLTFGTTSGFSLRVDNKKMDKMGHCVHQFFHFSKGSSLIAGLQDFVFSGQVGSLVVWLQHILSFWKKRPTAFSGAVADEIDGSPGESGRTHGSKVDGLGSSNTTIDGGK